MAQPTNIHDRGSSDQLDELVGQAVGEYFQCLESGPQPQLGEFVARYPEIRDLLKTVIPALQAAEGTSNASAGGVVDEQQHKQLGDFRILREIGRGGMGIVYEAEQTSMNRCVALKVLPLVGLVDELKIRRFQNVAVALSPDGKTLATGGNESEVRLWDTQTFEPFGDLKGHHIRMHLM